MRRILFGLACATVASQAFATGPAVQSFTGGTRFVSFWGSDISTPDVVGFQFTANADLSVTSLGIWQDNDAGLEERHEVGLWRVSDGTLLASTIVDGTGTLVGDFLYESISAVTLNTGDTYALGATYWGGGLDGYISSPTTATYDTDITHIGALSPASSNLGFVMPTTLTTSNRGRFGPNMITEPVPEPATLAVLGVGALALLRRRRK